jgi:hypothetical protein
VQCWISVQRVFVLICLISAKRGDLAGGDLKYSDTLLRTPHEGEVKDQLSYPVRPDGLERTVDFALQFLFSLLLALLEEL